MRLQQIKIALTKTYEGVDRYHMLQMAAAMSYYFVISLFPALIFLSGILAYIPIPDLFNQTLHMTGRFLPADEDESRSEGAGRRYTAKSGGISVVWFVRDCLDCLGRSGCND